MLTLLFPFVLAHGVRLEYRPSGMENTPVPYDARVVSMKPNAKLASQLSDWKSPYFGEVPVHGRRMALASEDEKGAPTRLVVDANGDGRLDESPIRWQAQTKGEWTRYIASLTVRVDGKQAVVSLYRVGGPGEIRAVQDYGYVGEAVLGGRKYPVMVSAELGPEAKIWIDRNGDGQRQTRAEVVSASQPFNFGGKSFELTPVTDGFTVSKAKKPVSEVPMPPELGVGKPMPKLAFRSTDGQDVRFPGSYKEKLVLLDFWATWCPPCIDALPEIGRTLTRFRDSGFDVLSVNLDDAVAKPQMEKLAKSRNLFWRQVHDGKGWKSPVVDALGLEGIPALFLVDGDTGRIVATYGEMSKDGIEKTVEAALSKRRP